jgi:hypothetical protein
MMDKKILRITEQTLKRKVRFNATEAINTVYTSRVKVIQLY